MVEAGGDPIRIELDDFVRAYEQAYARNGRASIAEFLPPGDSPHRAPVLRELVRVDLEYGWERGRPRTLSDYLEDFPELLGDQEGLREIASEESRLRRQPRADPAPGLLASSIALDAPGRWRAGYFSGRPGPGRLGDDSWEPGPGDGPAVGAGDRAGRDDMTIASLAYREFRIHHDPGDLASLDRWCESFQGDPGPARLLRDIHRSDSRAADRLARGITSLPRVGEDFAGFRLIGELGRGAFGRVYLARQGDLADRPVALKVSPRLFEEARSLARLQHTNIVPIHSAHRVGPFQAVCMPFFGSSTLKDVYAIISHDGTLPSSGLGLLTALRDHRREVRGRDGSGHDEIGGSSSAARDRDRAGAAPPADPGPATETKPRLERLTYVQAILWIASRLADGLAHAHERGILHRDLKPANILLTDDGQPMLLDFNLSADLRSSPDAMAALGGTLPYMSPEHLDACRGADRPVDARSDIYSLGIILHELLTGRAFSSRASPSGGGIGRLIEDRLGPAPDPRRWNKAVTPAVASIVRHCLEPDPARRYQAAGELREDLDRHLADRPLKYAPEPSLRERIAKWARRHPTLCGSASIALLGLVLVASLGAASQLLARELGVASARLHRDEFRTTFAECQLLLNTVGGDPGNLGRGVDLARRALHGYGVDGPGDWTAAPPVRGLPAPERRDLLEELSELVQLQARARIALSGANEDRRRALEREVAWLDRAERFDPRPSAALYEDRGRYNLALGRQAAADRDRALASRTSPVSARDFYLLGTSLLARGQADQAELPLSHAVALDARRFWAWFALGICHSDQGRHRDAAHDFSICTTLAPGFAWPHLNRGLALARSGRLPEARVACDRALAIDPDLSEGLVDRALVCLELGELGQAIHDLDRAIELGRRTPAVLTARAEALSRQGLRDEADRAFASAIQAAPRDPMPLVARGFSRLGEDRAGAADDFARALDLDPRNARARLGRAYLLRPDDRLAALSQLDSAIEADPSLGDAIQLRALLLATLGDPAAEADVDRLILTPTPQRLYNAACALSLLSRSFDAETRLVNRALDLLHRALDSGFPPARAADDPDLDPLRNSPRFPGTRGQSRSSITPISHENH